MTGHYDNGGICDIKATVFGPCCLPQDPPHNTSQHLGQRSGYFCVSRWSESLTG